MNPNKKLIFISRKFPLVSNFGFSILKSYWHFKSFFVNYNFPSDDNKATIDKNAVEDYNKLRPYGPKRKICYAPFNNLHFQINGNVSACSFNYDFIIGDINKNSINEIWFGDKANEFRRKLSNYNFEMCKSCEEVLKAKNYNSFPPLKYDIYSDDNTNYPNQMSFEMSNLCNYECVMCNENFSSLIRKRMNLPKQKFNYPESFFKDLQDFIPYLRNTTFIGGEPLIIKPYFRIWEDILRLNNLCTIHIQTNASYLPPRFLEMLETGQFDIGISLDAITKEVFEKIRINSKYEEVIENIATLKQYMDKHKVNLNINFCPLTLNWQEIPAILNYANELNIPLKIVNVENPKNLSLQHRNSSYLNGVIDYLGKNKVYETKNIVQKKNVQSYIQFINQLNYFTSQSQERERAYVYEKKDVFTNFRHLFNHSSLFNHFTSEQRQELYEVSIAYLNKISIHEKVKERTLFRIYYSLYKLKHTNNGEASTNIDYGKYILKKIIKEYYDLESEEESSFQ